MIQVGESTKPIGKIILYAGIVAWAAALALAGLLKPEDFRASIRYLGTATLVAAGVSFVLNRYLWQWPIFRDLLQVPDFSGRWIGWTRRSLTKEWRPSAEEITQRALDVTGNAWGPENIAHGFCASIVQDRHGNVSELVWSYVTESTSPSPKRGDVHWGTHFLFLSEENGKKILKGKYVTDRLRDDDTIGAGGYVYLEWESKKTKGGLYYDEKDWPPEPEPSWKPEDKT